LVSPSGTVVTLMSRPGLAEAADDGGGCCGFGGNLLVGFPITFVPGGATDAEAMGSAVKDVCAPTPGGDGLCLYNPNHGAAAAGDIGTSFTGQSPTGTWQLCVGDGGGGDVGTLNAVSINMTISG